MMKYTYLVMVVIVFFIMGDTKATNVYFDDGRNHFINHNTYAGDGILFGLTRIAQLLSMAVSWAAIILM